MNKKIGIIKRLTALLLIFLLSINSFAAVVSDNDGSAFITKAEFDSLKNNFQSQIDSYNQSIDSKIDGAIASYLSGIRLTQTSPVNFFYERTGSETNYVEMKKKGDFTRTSAYKNNYHVTYNRASTNSGNMKSSSSYNYFTFYTELATSQWSTMRQYMKITTSSLNSAFTNRGFSVDSNDESIITNIYNDYGLDIILNVGDAECFADGDGHVWLDNDVIISKPLGQIASGLPTYISGGAPYNDNPGHNKGEIDDDPAGKGKWETVDKDNGNYLNVPRLYSFTSVVTKRFNNEDENVYLWNECDEQEIMVNSMLDEDLEGFVDAVADTKGCVNFDYMEIPQANVVIAGAFGTLNTLYRPKHDFYIKKIRLKTTTSSKNLNTYKNGKLKYTDSAGTIVYPYFYNGYPLFKLPSKASEVKFTIRIDKNAGDASYNKVRLWISKAPFNNGVSYASSDIYSWDTGNNYFDINADTDTTITLKNVEKDVPYFLMWSLVTSSGTKLNFGGRLKKLTDGIATIAE